MAVLLAFDGPDGADGVGRGAGADGADGVDGVGAAASLAAFLQAWLAALLHAELLSWCAARLFADGMDRRDRCVRRRVVRVRVLLLPVPLLLRPVPTDWPIPLTVPWTVLVLWSLTVPVRLAWASLLVIPLVDLLRSPPVLPMAPLRTDWPTPLTVLCSVRAWCPHLPLVAEMWLALGLEVGYEGSPGTVPLVSPLRVLRADRLAIRLPFAVDASWWVPLIVRLNVLCRWLVALRVRW